MKKAGLLVGTLALVSAINFIFVVIAMAELVQVDIKDPGDGAIKAVCAHEASLYALMDANGDDWLWQYDVDTEGNISLAFQPQYSEENPIDIWCGDNFLYVLSEDRINVYEYHNSPEAGNYLEWKSVVAYRSDGSVPKLWGNGKWLVAGGGPDGVIVYEIHESGVLIPTDSVLGGSSPKIFHIWGDNNFLYVAVGATVYVYGIDVEGILTQLHMYEHNGHWVNVIGDGNFIYVSGDAGLYVYRVNNLGELILVNFDEQVTSIIHWCENNFLYAIDNTNMDVYTINNAGVVVLDEQLEFDWSDRVTDIYGDGNFIYLARYTKGVSVHKQLGRKKTNWALFMPAIFSAQKRHK